MSYSAAQELSSISFDKIIGGTLDAVVKAQSNSSITTVNFIKETGFKLDEKGIPIEPIYVEFKYPKEVSAYIPAKPEFFVVKVNKGGKGYSNEKIASYSVDGKSVELKAEFDQFGKIITANIVGKAESVGNITITLADGENFEEEASLAVEKVEKVEAQPAKYQDMNLKVPILTMLPIPFIRVATTDIELNVKINSMETTNSSTDKNSDTTAGGSAGYKGFGFNANASFNTSVSSQSKTSSTSEIKKEFSLNVKVHAVQDDMPAGISRILDILEESINPTTSNQTIEKIDGTPQIGKVAS